MAVDLQNLPEHQHSLFNDLDLLFNEKDGVLMEETLININNADGPLMFIDQIDSTVTEDNLFSNLLNDDFDVVSLGQDAYDHHNAASPLNSDSGISDGVGSPQYHSDSQSGGSPQRVEELEDDSFVETVDMSSYLIGQDTMLMEASTVDCADLDAGYDWDLKLSAAESKKSTLPLTVQDVKTISAITTTKTISTTDSCYPKLRLTDEEKRLLSDMNVSLPADMPLTKEEERCLKTVRRKIRNKISAMDSRKRKKVYVDGLEQRVHLCTKQNHEMQKTMAKLESQNKSLLEQLRKLQSLVSKTTTKAAQAGTCVMVLLLSFALLIAPSFNPLRSSKDAGPAYQPSGVVSRTLKHTQESYSYSTDPSVLQEQKLSENEPVNTVLFVKSADHGIESLTAANPDAAIGDDAVGIDTQQVVANEEAPTHGLPGDEIAGRGLHEDNSNRSYTDTRPVVKQTLVHGDEM